MWANPFRNKTNQTQSTRSFLSSKNIANKKVNGNAKKGKYIKKGFNGLGGTHNVFMPKKKSHNKSYDEKEEEIEKQWY